MITRKKVTAAMQRPPHQSSRLAPAAGARKAARDRQRRLWVNALLLLPSLFGLLLWPSAGKVRGAYHPRTLDGIDTIDDAVHGCRRTGLDGWELVAFAQQLVYRKFVYYSLLNLWDTPARAFSYGMGYCTQYNLALRQILERLGFATETLFSSRVRLADRPDWRLGHTWLRVRVGDEWREVCAGRAENRPGHNSFEPVAPVHRGNDAILFLVHLGMVVYLGLMEWKMLLAREEWPAWMVSLR
jgi:hypothetical protein